MMKLKTLLLCSMLSTSAIAEDVTIYFSGTLTDRPLNLLHSMGSYNGVEINGSVVYDAEFPIPIVSVNRLYCSSYLIPKTLRFTIDGFTNTAALPGDIFRYYDYVDTLKPGLLTFGGQLLDAANKPGGLLSPELGYTPASLNANLNFFVDNLYADNCNIRDVLEFVDTTSTGSLRFVSLLYPPISVGVDINYVGFVNPCPECNSPIKANLENLEYSINETRKFLAATLAELENINTEIENVRQDTPVLVDGELQEITNVIAAMENAANMSITISAGIDTNIETIREATQE